MGDAASEFADRFHLLRLAQGVLNLRSFLSFGAQLHIRGLQFSRPFRHKFAQRIAHLAAHACHAERAIDASDQFASGKRFHQIVVRAGRQAFDARFLAGARRDDDDGQIAQFGIGAYGFDEAETIQARHHDVRQHQIRPARTQQLERGQPIVGGGTFMPRIQQAAHVGTHVRVVVHYQDARARRIARYRCGGIRRHVGIGQPAQRLLQQCMRSRVSAG